MPANIYGAFYAVRDGAKCRVVGPCPTWQAACVEVSGCISDSMGVKCLGKDGYWVRKRKWLEQRLSERDGWFRPMLLNGLRVTLAGENALGPPEIAERMSAIGTAVRMAATRDEVERLFQEAAPYLPYLPVEICATFSDLVETRKNEFEIRDRWCLCRMPEVDEVTRKTGTCAHCGKEVNVYG